MNKPHLSPYLNFNGNCKEAMEFYQSVLGGKLEVSTVGDSPIGDVPDDQKNRVMHAALQNDMLSFMASDGKPETKVVFGDNIHMSLVGQDEALLTKFFEGLSTGGTIDTPLEKQFWGDTFGMLTDKYGIHWMVNISKEA